MMPFSLPLYQLQFYPREIFRCPEIQKAILLISTVKLALQKKKRRNILKHKILEKGEQTQCSARTGVSASCSSSFPLFLAASPCLAALRVCVCAWPPPTRCIWCVLARTPTVCSLHCLLCCKRRGGTQIADMRDVTVTHVTAGSVPHTLQCHTLRHGILLHTHTSTQVVVGGRELSGVGLTSWGKFKNVDPSNGICLR